jgi:hypothetical protein
LATGQVLLPWFDQNYLYRVEEGDPRFEPSKIEAVRKDGGDFDDAYLESLKRHLEASIFPRSLYTLNLQVDEFRRFVRIFVDFGRNERQTKRKDEPALRIIVPKNEIETRILTAK